MHSDSGQWLMCLVHEGHCTMPKRNLSLNGHIPLQLSSNLFHNFLFHYYAPTQNTIHLYCWPMDPPPPKKKKKTHQKTNTSAQVAQDERQRERKKRKKKGGGGSKCNCNHAHWQNSKLLWMMASVVTQPTIVTGQRFWVWGRLKSLLNRTLGRAN